MLGTEDGGQRTEEGRGRRERHRAGAGAGAGGWFQNLHLSWRRGKKSGTGRGTERTAGCPRFAKSRLWFSPAPARAPAPAPAPARFLAFCLSRLPPAFSAVCPLPHSALTLPKS